MKNKGEFNGTSFQFDLDTAVPQCLDSFCKKNQEGYHVLYNNSNLLFLEDTYIGITPFFTLILKKLKKKKYNNNLKIYIDNTLKEIEDIEIYNEEIILYKKIIDENNINGFTKNDLNISVKLFKKYYSDTKTKKLINICTLLLIANITNFKNEIFEFKVRFNESETVKLIDFNCHKIPDLSIFYEWIMLGKENHATRLRIVRELILEKNSFDLSTNDLDHVKSIFNRIIKEETDKYFEQMNILKSDFFTLSETNTKNYHSLHLKFLGWCSAIAVYIYDSLKEKPSSNLYHKLFLSSNEKVNIFLLIFILSLIIIWCIFRKEMRDYQKEYDKIKTIYTENFLFESDMIKEFLPNPNISIKYKIIFYTLMYLLCCRLLIPIILQL